MNLLEKLKEPGSTKFNGMGGIYIMHLDWKKQNMIAYLLAGVQKISMRLYDHYKSSTRTLGALAQLHTACCLINMHFSSIMTGPYRLQHDSVRNAGRNWAQWNAVMGKSAKFLQSACEDGSMLSICREGEGIHEEKIGILNLML